MQRSSCTLEEVKFAKCQLEDVIFDFICEIPSGKRLFLADEKFLPVLLKNIGDRLLFRRLQFIEFRVRDLHYAVHVLKEQTTVSAKSGSDKYSGIRLNLVINETEDISKLQGLDQDRLKVTFRRSYCENDFLGLLSEEGDSM